MIKIVGLLMFVCVVVQIYGSPVKFQIECDDLLKILAGIQNKDIGLPNVPIEITNIVAKVNKNGKLLDNPYHPEDFIGGYQEATTEQDPNLPTAWKLGKEIEMDIMKAEIEKQLDKENHNFIAKPSLISEDELDEFIDSKEVTKIINGNDTADNLQKIIPIKNGIQDNLQELEKLKNIQRDAKIDNEAVVIGNNAVPVVDDAKHLENNKKRFKLKRGDKEIKTGQVRIDYSLPKSETDSHDKDRDSKAADNQDFKDFQRRFILVDGSDKNKKKT